jgi:hypothetical protein
MMPQTTSSTANNERIDEDNIPAGGATDEGRLGETGLRHSQTGERRYIGETSIDVLS